MRYVYVQRADLQNVGQEVYGVFETFEDAERDLRAWFDARRDLLVDRDVEGGKSAWTRSYETLGGDFYYIDAVPFHPRRDATTTAPDPRG